MNNEAAAYRTQSLYEASFLLARGFKLIAANTDGPKATLLFADSVDLQQTILDFYNSKGMVRAKPFVDAYRSLKDMVFRR